MPVSRSLLLAMMLGLPLVAQADYRAYARGQAAAADGRWNEVEDAMQEAMADNATPKVRVKLYGQRFAPYVPQYYLGLAAYKRNDCSGALRWFGDAAAAPVIAQVSDFKGVADAARGDCNAKVASTQKPTPTAPVTQQPVAQTPPPTQQAPKPTTPPPTAPKPVVDKPATPTTQTPAKPTPTQPVAPATPAVPAALQNALQNWLAGRYRGVVAGSTAGLQSKALAHTHLLRAAAFHALIDVEPANAAAHRTSAEREVRSARSALPAIAADPGFFSPRFRQFFAGVR